VIQPSCRIDTEAVICKPYSQDLRERVIAAVDTGTGAYVAALLFQVSVSYIYKALHFGIGRAWLDRENAARQRAEFQFRVRGPINGKPQRCGRLQCNNDRPAAIRPTIITATVLK
jgi:hypothetical protein